MPRATLTAPAGNTATSAQVNALAAQVTALQESVTALAADVQTLGDQGTAAINRLSDLVSSLKCVGG